MEMLLIWHHGQDQSNRVQSAMLPTEFVISPNLQKKYDYLALSKLVT